MGSRVRVRRSSVAPKRRESVASIGSLVRVRVKAGVRARARVKG